MILERLVVGSLEANAYVLGSGQTHEAFIIDAGDDGDYIIDRLRRMELTPRLLVNTHGHADHIMANATLKSAFPELKIAVHHRDAPMLASAVANLSELVGIPFVSPPPDILLNDGDRLSVGDLVLQTLHTPGHTPGGICLLYVPADAAEPRHLFTGDTLFAGRVGRTNFPGGNLQQLLQSIRERLLSLPAECICHPGHGPVTTIGAERRTNPFLVG